MPSLQVTELNHEVLDTIAASIADSNRILVITGAGISTNCGVPDFRSQGGIYAKTLATVINELSSRTMNRQEVVKINQSIPSSQRNTRIFDLFQSSIAQQSPATAKCLNILIVLLHRFIRTIQPPSSGTHAFIKELRDSGRLLRCYTQNIDSLEVKVGLSTDINSDVVKVNEEVYPRIIKIFTEVVPLHGKVDTVCCRSCNTVISWDASFDQIYLDGYEPTCPRCEEFTKTRKQQNRRLPNVGSLRPNIVLYGESHTQQSTIESLIDHDLRSEPEVLLIIGTSMNTTGIQKLIKALASNIHQRSTGQVICINRSPKVVGGLSNCIDFFVNMDCDKWVQDLRRRRADIIERFEPRPLSGLMGTPTVAKHIRRDKEVEKEEEEEEAIRWLEAFF